MEIDQKRALKAKARVEVEWAPVYIVHDDALGRALWFTRP
jgi:hypothetical protein